MAVGKCSRGAVLAARLTRVQTPRSLPYVAHRRLLTRPERNEGIKRLLNLGWTDRRIAEATGASKSTVSNIGQGRALRDSLPPEVGDALHDTQLYRIAALAAELQATVATVAGEAGWSVDGASASRPSRPGGPALMQDVKRRAGRAAMTSSRAASGACEGLGGSPVIPVTLVTTCRRSCFPYPSCSGWRRWTGCRPSECFR
jgi:hypothetical protein